MKLNIRDLIMKKYDLKNEAIDAGKNNTNALFQHYRQAGISLSATLILLSSGVMAWVYNSRFDLSVQAKLFFNTSILALGLAILFALLMQYFHYKGSFYHARVILADSEYQKKAKKYFNWADMSVLSSMISFLIGVILATIFWKLDT